MVVKSNKRHKRAFSGVEFFVGAVGERMMIICAPLKKGQEAVSHSHPHEQAGYCIQGRVLLTIDEESTEIEPDDSYVIPGGVAHSVRVLEDALLVEMFSPPREEYR